MSLINNFTLYGHQLIDELRNSIYSFATLQNKFVKITHSLVNTATKNVHLNCHDAGCGYMRADVITNTSYFTYYNQLIIKSIIRSCLCCHIAGYNLL